MILYIGLDDTDTPTSEGTNQLARRIARALPSGCRCRAILRHQLLRDPRVPCTSKNGCASLLIEGHGGWRRELVPLLIETVRSAHHPGSDPGLCVAERVPSAAIEFGRLCRSRLVRQEEARELALACDIELHGLGGSEDGVIGALAAVGLAASGEDGRVVHLAGWPWPDDFSGAQTLAALRARGVEEVRELASGALVSEGIVDVGKRLRPAYRGSRVVLFVERAVPPEEPAAVNPVWRGLKLD